MIKRSHSWNDSTAQSNGQSVTRGYVHHTRNKCSVFRLIWRNVRISGRIQGIFDVANLLTGLVGNLLEFKDWKLRMIRCQIIFDSQDKLTKNEQSSQNGRNNEPNKARYWNHSGVVKDHDGVCRVGRQDIVVHGPAQHVPGRAGGQRRVVAARIVTSHGWWRCHPQVTEH